MTWHAGVSWDRNVQAGILSRSVAFAGVGHVWWARKDLKFDTSYGLSWTDRTEEIQDPEKEDRFPGVRFSWNYTNRWGKFVTYKNDWRFNISLSDISDYSSTMSQSVAVPMSSHLALKVSLQWKYNSEPALEDVSVLAQVVVVDPDGIPGSGDEFFETVESGGTTIDLGCVPKPNEPLDTVFTSSLTISF